MGTTETERRYAMTEKATFGAGCFWGVEDAYRHVKGVVATTVGYMGGTLENPTYHDVCSGLTGHTEVVEVEYDPSQVTYEELRSGEVTLNGKKIPVSSMSSYYKAQEIATLLKDAIAAGEFLVSAPSSPLPRQQHMNKLEIRGPVR
jgi:hypothetical protein